MKSVALAKKGTWLREKGVLNLELQDTITGLLLAGIGNIDNKQKKNFLVVDSS